MSFHRDPDAFGLEHLPDIEELTEVRGYFVVARHVLFDRDVADRRALMRLHDFRQDVVVAGLRISLHGFEFRERLEAVLAHEAADDLAIAGERLLAPPHAPIVDVARLKL